MQDMEFLRANLLPGELSTFNDNDNTNDDNYNTTWTVHDYIGSLAFMACEPKISRNGIHKILKLQCFYSFSEAQNYLEKHKKKK